MSQTTGAGLDQWVLGSAKLCGLWKEGKPGERAPKASALARDLTLPLPPSRGPRPQWEELPWERKAQEVPTWQVTNVNVGARQICQGYH